MTQDCKQFEKQSNWLVQGSKGDLVENMQRDLRTLGYYKYRIDKDFGPKTFGAVQAFQRKEGLTPDGKYGNQTCKALNKKINGNTTKTNKTSTNPPQDYNIDCTKLGEFVPSRLNPNNDGGIVKNLQIALHLLGLYDDDQGIFGAVTEEAVMKFQRKYNTDHPTETPLHEDGFFDQDTCQKVKAAIEAKNKQFELDCTKMVDDNMPRRGNKDNNKDTVSKIQSYMKTLGFYSADKVGVFGIYTEEALIKFQKKWNKDHPKEVLHEDGYLDQLTCQKLRVAVNSRGKVKTKKEYVLICPNIDLNKTNRQSQLKDSKKKKQVEQLQTYLKELGYYTRQVDGDYGDKTEQAVKDYQTWWNKTHPKPAIGPLAVDGKFGPITCGKLKETIEEKAKEAEKKTAKNKIVKQKEIIIDAKKYNYIKAEDANFTIEGLHFIITDFKETNGYRVRPWKTTEMMDDTFYRYKGHMQPCEYTCTIFVSDMNYQNIKPALLLLQEKERCKVICAFMESGDYYLDISRTLDKWPMWKLELHLTEVI